MKASDLLARSSSGGSSSSKGDVICGASWRMVVFGVIVWGFAIAGLWNMRYGVSESLTAQITLSPPRMPDSAVEADYEPHFQPSLYPLTPTLINSEEVEAAIAKRE